MDDIREVEKYERDREEFLMEDEDEEEEDMVEVMEVVEEGRKEDTQ